MIGFLLVAGIVLWLTDSWIAAIVIGILVTAIIDYNDLPEDPTPGRRYK